MTEPYKGPGRVIAPEEGDGYWQPLPSVGYTIAKVTPDNSPYDDFATGIQVLEPGAHIRRHAHERSHEFLFCYRGTGYAELDGERYEVVPESLILLGRRVVHKVVNTGDTQMRLLWLMAPAGLEDWFAALGRPRTPGDPLPTPFPRPTNIEQIQAQQRFVRGIED